MQPNNNQLDKMRQTFAQTGVSIIHSFCLFFGACIFLFLSNTKLMLDIAGILIISLIASFLVSMVLLGGVLTHMKPNDGFFEVSF